MEVTQVSEYEDGSNPLDIIEAILADGDWAYERPAEDELSVAVQGHWATYNVTFSWHDALEAMHVACTFDTKAAQAKRAEMISLLALINEQLWAGHFDMWSEDGMIIFRHGVMLQGDAGLTPEQAHALLELPVDCCERYFPAVQFVLWGGKTAGDAMAAAMLDTAGQA